MPSERALRIAAAALAVAGIGVATYITIADASGGAPSCFAGGHGCATVANSRYSHIGGINVAVFGVVGYALLLAAALAPGDPGRFGGLVGSLIGFGFSAYLTYLELFVINAICQWCVGERRADHPHPVRQWGAGIRLRRRGRRTAGRGRTGRA
jgi:uncharacterized membrane protein